MSARRVLNFVLGVIIGGVLLALLLPFVGVPSSHYLPPGYVYGHATGKAGGAVIDKYYSETANPFHVGEHQYFVDYQFKAPAPPARGTTTPGPKQLYTGTARVSKTAYDAFTLSTDQQQIQFKGNEKIAVTPHYPVKIKYETTNPDINGIDATWTTDDAANAEGGQGGRSVGPGSNTFSGWIIWIVVSLFLGFIFAIGLSKFGKQEDI